MQAILQGAQILCSKKLPWPFEQLSLHSVLSFSLRRFLYSLISLNSATTRGTAASQVQKGQLNAEVAGKSSA